MDSSRVTVVMVPRERFSLQVRIMHLLKERSPEGIRVIVFDTGSSQAIARETRKTAEAYGFEVVRYEACLSGNDCRNLARSMVKTDYVVFIDNDLEVKEGWLEPLVQCLDETEAWAVMPLYLEINEGKKLFHAAGTRLWGEHKYGRTIYAQELILSGQPCTEEKVAALQRCEVEALEYHLFAMRMDKWDRIGPFDPKILSSHDHIDFSLCILAAGGTIMMEPKSIVTYDKDEPLLFHDLPYYFMRWSCIWVQPSLSRFSEKWGIGYKPHPERWYDSLRAKYASGWIPWLKIKPRRLLWRLLFSHLDALLLKWVEARFWTPAQELRERLFLEAFPGGYSRELEDKCRAFGGEKFKPVPGTISQRTVEQVQGS